MEALRRLAARTWHTGRGLLERALHPLRRRHARAAVSRLPAVRSVLFICHGNICRSPYAAAVFARSRPDLTVSSAGFIGPGRSPPPGALRVAARRNVNISDHTSSSISRERCEAADLVIVMDTAQRARILHQSLLPAGRVVLLGDLDPEPANGRTILDPVSQPDEKFEASYARIDRCVESLLRLLPPVD